MAQEVKDPVLSRPPLGLLPWRGFSPWRGNVHQHRRSPPPPPKRKEILIGCSMDAHGGSVLSEINQSQKDESCMPLS